MWRYLAGGVAALLMVAAAVLVMGRRVPSGAALPPVPLALAGVAGDQAVADPLPDAVPEASAKSREQKRFGRYDKDRNGAVTRDEYLISRRKAFAKLDRNGDGALQFDEWAIKAETKFAAADADKSGAMNAAEFATTAVKRKAARRAKCPPAAAAAAADAGRGEDDT